MVKKRELIEELKSNFEKTKKELGFSSEYEKINGVFFIEDGVLEHGFVSNSFERQLCLRLVSKFYSWNGQLHAWLMPPPGDLITNTEYKKFNEDDKKIMRYLIEKAMYFLRVDKINAFKNDKKEMGKLVDEMMEYHSEFSRLIEELLVKSKETWESELSNEKKT